jgi:UDP-N-acetyl-2-amino-2-deoxyglucuronate dehydrogenase
MTDGSQHRVGILGCGEVARRYPAAIDATAGLELVAVNDAITAAGSSFGSDFGVEPISDLDRFLSLPLDLVCICTPNHTHAELGRTCLDHGFHVLVEHPLALTAAEGEELAEAAARLGRRLFVMRQRRFLPSVQSLKEILALGALGEIRAIVARMAWHRPADYYAKRPWRARAENGGVVLNQASHFLDILLYLFGEPREVSGLLGNIRHRIPVEDTFYGRLEFGSRLLAEFSCTTAAPRGCSWSLLTVTGGNGAATLSGRAWERLEHKLDRPAVAPTRTPRVGGGDHADFLQRVSRRLAGEEVEVVEAEESLPALRLAESIYANAAWDGERLRDHFASTLGEGRPDLVGARP